MYSNLKNVQILVAGLKAYRIRRVVISPGNSHNAIVRSIEEDGSFQTYSVVDERSAAFFACGLCQELREPVAILCTSGTAASNYLTGVTEASRRELPLVVITGDKNPYYLGQNEDQMIDARAIFTNVVRDSVLLPICRDKSDEWYCARLVNQALLELDHHGTGPVQIDVPIEQGMLATGASFTTHELPLFPKIDRIDMKSDEAKWDTCFASLRGKRILIMYGQDYSGTAVTPLLDVIARKYDAVVSVDKLSNLHADCCVETQTAANIGSAADGLLPDVIISLAGNPATQYKFSIKNRGTESWLVLPEGQIRDYYHGLRYVFECDHVEFLQRMADANITATHGHYLTDWKQALTLLPTPEFNWSNLYAIHGLMSRIPADSILNLANSSTIRLAQYFPLDPSITVYCNRGVNGIDGCMSTFIGQSAAHNGLSYLIIGDLTFFYDMNALWNRYVGPNVRIMLINNGGAALFHFNQGLRTYPQLDENVAAKHSVEAQGWVESLGIRYARATDEATFDKALVDFTNPNITSPMLLECVTTAAGDAAEQHRYYDQFLPARDKTIASAKTVIKRILGK